MASQLDGAGQIKMAVLDEALQATQRLHGIVERYGVAVKTQQETGSYRMQLQRAATPLVGMLKPQFGPVADMVSAFLLISSRGGSDQTKLRGLRESVAQIRAQLEISVTKVKEKHTIPHEITDRD